MTKKKLYSKDVETNKEVKETEQSVEIILAEQPKQKITKMYRISNITSDYIIIGVNGHSIGIPLIDGVTKSNIGGKVEVEMYEDDFSSAKAIKVK